MFGTFVEGFYWLICCFLSGRCKLFLQFIIFSLCLVSFLLDDVLVEKHIMLCQLLLFCIQPSICRSYHVNILLSFVFTFISTYQTHPQTQICKPKKDKMAVRGKRKERGVGCVSCTTHELWYPMCIV